MGRVEAFDISTNRRRPVGNDGRSTAIAARLVGQFPGEDCGAGLVTAHNSTNIRLVLSLNFGISIPRGFTGAIVSIISGHSSIIPPVVHKIYYQFDPV